MELSQRLDADQVDPSEMKRLRKEALEKSKRLLRDQPARSVKSASDV